MGPVLDEKKLSECCVYGCTLVHRIIVSYTEYIEYTCTQYTGATKTLNK